eukprot:8318375-Pyramimonas_sp.AAC.1
MRGHIERCRSTFGATPPAIGAWACALCTLALEWHVFAVDARRGDHVKIGPLSSQQPRGPKSPNGPQRGTRGTKDAPTGTKITKSPHAAKTRGSFNSRRLPRGPKEAPELQNGSPRAIANFHNIIISYHDCVIIDLSINRHLGRWRPWAGYA